MGIATHVIDHVVDEQKYEVKTFWMGSGWVVSIWNGVRRIGPVYSVGHMTPEAADKYRATETLQALMDIAIADLDAGRVMAEAP